MCEYLKTRSHKLISSNSLVRPFEKEELKYHQKRRFAIGIKFAPPYFNLLMAGLEKRMIQKSEFKPFLWLRYLDEIFCI